MVTSVAQKEANRRWRERNPEYQREYRRRHPDKFRGYREKARVVSSAKAKDRRRRYAKLHLEQNKLRQKKYRRTLKYKIKELQRKLVKLDGMRELLENSLALLREHPFCDVCGTSLDLRIHHRVPLSEGGNHKKENLGVLCEKHHWSRGTGIHWEEKPEDTDKQLHFI